MKKQLSLTDLYQRARDSLLWYFCNNIEFFQSRFIINLPPEECDQIRIFFHLNNAYWYYEDFLYPIANETEKLKEYDFYKWLITPVSSLDDIRKNITTYYRKYKEYSKAISVYGAILLNSQMDQILLGREVMNQTKTVYSFPKGKINQGENGVDCAVREVWEEVGYDISKQIEEEEFIQLKCEKTGQIKKFFVITNVDQSFQFKTNTRNEIGEIKWVKISQVMNKNNRNKYLSLFPFMDGLQQYINHWNQKRSIKTYIEEVECYEPQNKQMNQVNVMRQLDDQLLVERTRMLQDQFEEMTNKSINILKVRLNQYYEKPFEQFKMII